MAKFFRRDNKKKSKQNKGKNLHRIAECSAPSFRIDLLRPPSQRWAIVVKNYHKEIKRLIQAILLLEQYQMPSDDEEGAADVDGNFFSNLTDGIFASLKNLGASTYIEEIRGIAKLLEKDGVTIENILMVHLLYESFCGCTSIITRSSKSDSNNSNADSLVLGRTLDWMDFDDQLLRKLTIDVEVYRGNQYLYRYTTFAGYIGALTALKFGHFAFAINFRECATNEPPDGFHEGDTWPIGILGRYVCEQCQDYESALKVWNEVPLMAPTYIMLSGIQESVLITRDEAESLNSLEVKIMEQSEEQKESAQADSGSRSYLLQTNIDHWLFQFDGGNSGKQKKGKKRRKKEKSDINDTMDSIRRLNVAHKNLNECDGQMDEEAMWKLLYLYPIHDRSWTLFTTVMNVKSGYYKTKRHIYK